MATVHMQETLIRLEEEYRQGHNPLGYIPYAEALRRSGRLSEALAICMREVKPGNASIAGRLLFARILADVGKKDQAAEQCELVLARVPQSQGARRLLIEIALSNRQFLRVVQLVDEMEAVVPDDPELLTALYEAQRGLAIQFLQTMRTRATIAPSLPNAGAPSAEDLVEKISGQAGVEICGAWAPGEGDGPLSEMLTEWREVLGPSTTITMAIIESPEFTIFMRRLGASNRVLVVGMTSEMNIGPIKLLADRLCEMATAPGGGN